MNKIIIAIDPGLKGCAAVYFADTGKVEKHRWQNESEAFGLLYDLKILAENNDYCPIVAYVEDCPETTARFPRNKMIQGYIATGMESRGFKLGRNLGFWTGLLRGLSIRTELVKPAEWQKCYPHTSGNAKTHSRKSEFQDYATRIFTNFKIIAQVDADALLLLDYAMGKEHCK